ncbi:hypothetical protein EPI10_024724 [Gossypium australe]|uniref:Uncharacterized protein n=1 Tax=Gossypium australe TaxID=47621 RepID=A0A5B6VZR6_9ROSI|nr:hypothetical protein EPI10_024724 [Gossypium australe]
MPFHISSQSITMCPTTTYSSTIPLPPIPSLGNPIRLCIEPCLQDIVDGGCGDVDNSYRSLSGDSLQGVEFTWIDQC